VPLLLAAICDSQLPLNQEKKTGILQYLAIGRPDVLQLACSIAFRSPVHRSGGIKMVMPAVWCC